VLESVAIYFIYGALGDLNRQFTPPPTGIQPIWLPAGFAVGVVLTRGWWTTIPLFLTGIIRVLESDWALTRPLADGGGGLSESTVVWAAVLYGLAVVSHCVIAKLIVDRLPGDGSWDELWSASALLLVVGPISCVASALLGTEVFRVEGFVTADTFAVSAFTFWIGDSMACILLVPPMLALLGGAAWRPRRTAILVTCFATIAIVVASTTLIGQNELERIQQRFERSTVRSVDALDGRLQRLESLATGTATLIGAIPDLDAEQFDSTVAGRVASEQDADLVAYLSTADGELDATTVTWARGAGEADFRASFVAAPIVERLALIRDSGRTDWVPEVDDPGATSDFVYAPVYRGGTDPTTLSRSERRRLLEGFVAVKTELQVALDDAVEDVVDRDAAVVLRDERGGTDAMVIASRPPAAINPLVDEELVPLEVARTNGVPFASSSQLDVGDSTWSVTFAPSRAFVSDRAFFVTILPSALIAMAFALTIGILVLTSTGQRARLARLVRQRTGELHASEQRYRSVVDNVHEAIFQLDPDGLVTFVSASWDDRLTLGGRDAALGHPLVGVLRVADPARLEELLADARSRPGTTVRGEFESLDHALVLEVRVATPRVDPREDDESNGHEAGAIVGMVVDMTDQRGVLRNRERFVSLVAHELRNPLTVISGSVSTIVNHEREQLPPLASKLLPAVQTSAHKLDRIISDLLVSSQVDAGTLSLLEEPADLVDITRAAIESATPHATEHGVEIVDRLPTEPLQLTCDIDRVTQVVDNLLSNAVKYTPGGGTIAVTAATDGSGLTARIRISDTGIGVSADDRDRIFERYGRTEQGTVVAPGTGLGLSICRAIAEAHGGSIEVESELGIGSTFTLVLPLR
jgi:signal transduction histidine kinase